MDLYLNSVFSVISEDNPTDERLLQNAGLVTCNWPVCLPRARLIKVNWDIRSCLAEPLTKAFIDASVIGQLVTNSTN